MAALIRHMLWIIHVAKGFPAELAALKLTQLFSTFLAFWHRWLNYDTYCQD